MQTNQIELPIFVKWYDFLKTVMLVTDKFPKSARFTFLDRIQNLCLDGLADLISARFDKKHSKSKIERLHSFNLKLENLRVLLRLCHELKFLSHERYEGLSIQIMEIGRLLGGWLKQQTNSPERTNSLELKSSLERTDSHG